MLTFNKKELLVHIKKIEKAQHNALRKATRRSLAAAYNTAWEISKKQYHRLPKNENCDTNTSFKNRTEKIARTSTSNMEAVLRASNQPYSQVHSVVGSRYPRKQRGIKIDSRPPLSVKIGGKQIVKQKGQFIAAPKKTPGVTQIFIRSKKDSGSFLKLATESIVALLQQEVNQKKIEDAVNLAVKGVYDETFK